MNPFSAATLGRSSSGGKPRRGVWKVTPFVGSDFFLSLGLNCRTVTLPVISLGLNVRSSRFEYLTVRLPSSLVTSMDALSLLPCSISFRKWP